MFGSTRAYSGFAVDDLAKAHQFYGETLRLEVTEFLPGLTLNLPGDRDTIIYLKPDFAPATYTILNFEVPDIEAAVDEPHDLLLAEDVPPEQRRPGIEVP